MKHKKILDAMFASIEEQANKNNSRRTYMGMSGFGGNCQRKQWLEFRHAFTPFINYQSATFFEDGHHCEDLLVKRLIESGFELIPVDEDGRQFEYVEGFVKGHCDGLCRIDGEKMVWEAKASNEAKLLKLKKLISEDEHSALEKWDYQYYCQAQWYMGKSGLKKHVLMCGVAGMRESKNSKRDARTAIVETLFNEEKFKSLQQEAKDLIATDKMPEAPWSLAAKKPLCWWGEESYQRCEAYDYCTGNDLGEPSCFNCAFIKFLESGVGRCTLHKKEVTPAEMQGFKECHKYHPSFIHQYECIQQNEDGSVLYRNQETGEEIINEDSREFRKNFKRGIKEG